MGGNGRRIATVPNQRIIRINKQPTDKQHRYTANNLAALDEAATKLQSIGGFKLYIYLAKNQNNYEFALSSSDFMQWSNLGKQAYSTAFYDLVNQGYLVKDKTQKNRYIFYDKCQEVEKKDRDIDNVVIGYNSKKQEEIARQAEVKRYMKEYNKKIEEAAYKTFYF